MKDTRDPYRFRIIGVGVLLAAFSLMLSAWAASSRPATVGGPAEYDLTWNTIDGGGVMFSTGGDYELSGTIGQPDASGPMISGEYELTGGFWFAQVPGDCVFDGAVNLLDHATFIGCSAGPNTSPTGNGCACFDMDNDNDVDLDDYGRFQRQFNGS